MIWEWLAPAGQLVLPWPLLAVLAAVLVLLFGMACYGKGRRDALREVDEQRAAVRRACEDAALPPVALLLPSPRQGSD